jgi:hypothetical protein
MEIKGDGVVRQVEGAAETPGAAVAPSTPTQCPLPTCRAKEIAKLNQMGAFQLYQCGKCLHEWKVPLSPAEIAKAAPYLTLTLPEELRAAEPCIKGCGEDFRFPPAKKDHEAGCLGPPRKRIGQTPKETTVATAELLRCRKGCKKVFVHQKRRQNHEGGCKGGGKQAAPALAPRAAAQADPVSGALKDLRDRRAAIIASHPELRKIDSAIAALEKVEAGELGA